MALTPKEKQDTLETNASKILDQCDTVTLASVNEDGFPRACIVTKEKNIGFSEIYFATSSKSRKAKHFLACNKASVSFYQNGDSVTLIGYIEIIEDMNIKKEIWKPNGHFQKGPGMPSFCVLKFKAIAATFCINHSFGTYKYNHKHL